MYDPALRRAVLARLVRWRRLPEGDLVGMLSPLERLGYRAEVLHDLQWQGFVEIATIGDEPVVSLTDAGERWYAESAQTTPSAPSGAPTSG